MSVVRGEGEGEASPRPLSLDSALTRLSELTKQRRQLMAALHRADADLRSVEEQRATERREAAQTLHTLNCRCVELSDELSNVRTTSRAHVARLEEEVRLATGRETVLQQEVAVLEERVGIAEAALATKAAAPAPSSTEEELIRAQMRITELEQSRSDAELLVPQLRSELTRSMDVERNARATFQENQRLRAQLQNTELAQAELASLYSRCKRLETVAARCGELEAEISQLLDERAVWMAALRHHEPTDDVATTEDAAGLPSPTDIFRALRDARRDVLLLTERLGNATTETRRNESVLREAQDRVVVLEKELETSRAATTAAVESRARQERFVNCVTKERDLLRKLIEEDPQEGRGEGDLLRIRTLEESLAHCESQFRDVERRVMDLQGGSAGGAANEATTPSTPLAITTTADLTTRAVAAEEEARRLTSVNDRLQKELSKAEQDLAVLEARMGRGEFDPRKTKVLHFAANPETLERERVKDELASLRAENNLLRSRLLGGRSVTGESVAAMDTSGGESSLPEDAYLRERSANEELRRLLEQAGVKEQRLKEIFLKQTSRFRDACRDLFGWKVDMMEEQRECTQYRLRSEFAQSDSDIVMFQSSPLGAGMDLLETEFVTRQGNRVRAFLTECNSIPAFLSNIQLELFNERTHYPVHPK